MKTRRLLLFLTLSALASTGQAFPFWLESASRRNGNDPRSEGYSPPNTPMPSLNTHSPTRTGTPTLTFTAVDTVTDVVTPIGTDTSTIVVTTIDTPTATHTPTATGTATSTFTPTDTPGGSAVPSDTWTSSPVVTPTSTFSPTSTCTWTSSSTATFSATPTPTPTRTSTPTATATFSLTATAIGTPITGELVSCGAGFSIDGQLAEAYWAGGTWQDVSKVTAGTLGLGAAARFQTHWDSSALYVAVQVSKSPGTLYAGSPLWSSDSVELYFDMGHNKAVTYDANDFHYTFGWANGAPDVAGGSLTGVAYAFADNGAGWNAEIAIPWSTLGVTPAQGAVYGFDLAANIASASGTRLCQLTWNSTSGTNYLNTSLFGEMVLGAACPYFTPTQTATPTATSIYSATPTPLRGATLPYTEYEAEAVAYSGTLLGPSFANANVAAESSGRKAVRLDATGQYVSISNSVACNAIVVRVSIPDSVGGGGLDSTLSLYVNGVYRQKLNVTSRYSWDYGGWSIPYNQSPSGGSPVHQYDETRALIGAVAAGSTLTLQKDASDGAAYYVVDLIDLEQVAPPGTQPANSLSIVNYGAISGDNGDDRNAIQNCINDAKNQGKEVWIPAGDFQCFSSTSYEDGLVNNGVTIRGAGMWYSNLHGYYARFLNNAASNCRYYDFAILGESSNRVDSNPDSAFNGQGGTGSRLQNIWVEHTKCGYWVGGTVNVSNGLVIQGCRFRNLYADAVNFCNGTSNSIVTQCHARNTGDDAFASWSPSGSGVNTNNLFSFNTVQQPWRASGFAVYGGNGTRVEDNVVADTYNYPGIRIAQEFGSNGFSNTTSVQRNTLTRAGGRWNSANEGALRVAATQGALSGVLIKDNFIDAPVYYGIHFSGANAINGTVISGTVINAGTFNCLRAEANTTGTVNCDNVAVTGVGTLFSGGMTFVKGAGNSGW